MSDPQTWTALKATLANWLDRTDLSATEIPEAIALAERRLNRVLRVPEMEEVATASTDAGTVTLPGGFLEMRSVFIDRSPKVALEQMSLADLRALFPGDATGVPVHFALQSGNEIVFGPVPGGTFTYVLNYYETIPALGAAQAANWLLLAHPDIYLYASLAELFVLVRDAEGLALAETRLAERLADLGKQGIKKAFGPTPLVARSGIARVRNIAA